MNSLYDRPLVLLMPTKHMGNLLVALHSIAALASTNKNTLVVVDEAYKDIVESIQGIDNVLYYPRGRLRKANFSGRLKLLYHCYRTLRAHRADLLLNFDAQMLATLMAMISGANTRWGLTDSARGELYTKVLDSNRRPHRYYHYAQFVTELSGPCDEARYPQLGISAQHQQALNSILATHQTNQALPYVCIHAGATKAYKQWPAANFAHTADWLAEQGFQVIFIGAGDADKATLEEVERQSATPHTNLCNKLNLGELMALFSSCAFFLGNDSGPMHLATATGVPVFALFGPTDVQRWGPLGNRVTIIRDPQPCMAVCSKKFCPQGFRCLKLLDESIVQDILNRHLVKLTRPQPASAGDDIPAATEASPIARNSQSSSSKL